MTGEVRGREVAEDSREDRECRERGVPNLRLTAVEQEHAREAVFAAVAAGYRRLRWQVPAWPSELGAVWPFARLWTVPVDHPYGHGPVQLTTRRGWRPRRVIMVLRSPGLPVEPAPQRCTLFCRRVLIPVDWSDPEDVARAGDAADAGGNCLACQRAIEQEMKGDDDEC